MSLGIPGIVEMFNFTVQEDLCKGRGLMFPAVTPIHTQVQTNRQEALFHSSLTFSCPRYLPSTRKIVCRMPKSSSSSSSPCSSLVAKSGCLYFLTPKFSVLSIFHFQTHFQHVFPDVIQPSHFGSALTSFPWYTHFPHLLHLIFIIHPEKMAKPSHP